MKRGSRIALSLAAGAAVSWAKLAFHCRRPIAEACVWGKAYMPFTFPVETVLVGVVLFSAWTILERRSGT